MMSRQEIFEKVRDHLLAQGEESLAESGSCAYRGEGGLRCAIGVLIPDEMYNPSFEGCAVDSLCDRSGYEGPLPEEFSIENSDFLFSLQSVHDDIPPARWATVLDEIALREGLTP